MDSVFQSLLLGGGNVTVDKDKSTSSSASPSATTVPGSGGGNNGIVKPSRYATLIPREALKIKKSSISDNDGNNFPTTAIMTTMKPQEKEEAEAEAEAEAKQEEEKERVAVYKLVTGELTL